MGEFTESPVAIRALPMASIALNAVVAITAFRWSSAGHSVPSVVITAVISVITMATPILIGLRTWGYWEPSRLASTARRELQYWGALLAFQFVGALVSFLIVTATFEYAWWFALQLAAFASLGAIYDTVRTVFKTSRPTDSVVR